MDKKLAVLVFTMFACTGIVLADEPMWDGIYYVTHSNMQRVMAESALKHIAIPDGASILDIGCGDGKITRSVADSVKNSRVIGIDHSSSMIQATQKHADETVTFLVRDATDLKLDQMFDRIISFCCLHWVKEIDKALNEVKKALKPDGKALLLVVPKQHMHHMVDKVALGQTWSRYFSGDSVLSTYLSFDGWMQALNRAGLVIESCTIEKIQSSFADQEALGKWLGAWIPAPEVNKELYWQDAAACYINNTSGALQADNSVIYEINQLVLVVKKSIL